MRETPSFCLTCGGGLDHWSGHGLPMRFCSTPCRRRWWSVARKVGGRLVLKQGYGTVRASLASDDHA